MRSGGHAHIEPSVAYERRAVLQLHHLRVSLSGAACQQTASVLQPHASALRQLRAHTEREARAGVGAAHVALRAVEQTCLTVVAEHEDVKPHASVLHAQSHPSELSHILGGKLLCAVRTGETRHYAPPAVHGAYHRSAPVVCGEVYPGCLTVVHTAEPSLITQVGMERSDTQCGRCPPVSRCAEQERSPLLPHRHGFGAVAAHQHHVGCIGQEEPRSVHVDAAHHLRRVVEIARERLPHECHRRQTETVRRHLRRRLMMGNAKKHSCRKNECPRGRS